MHLPPDLQQRITRHGQDHLLAGWDDLDAHARAAFVQQLERLDFPQLERLYAQREAGYEVPAAERIAPLPGVLPDGDDAKARRIGEAALSNGEVAALVVAGGQGSRLGFDHPKGLFPVGPVSGASLFQFHAEKVLARGRKHGKPIPFLVMTSTATHAETEAFFEQHGYFGLSPEDVYFFQQGTMPALDLATGRVLLDGPGQLFTGPNGHGGTLTALADTGLLDQLAHRGVKHLFYFQVDNPLVKIADPQFLGQHVRAGADVSSKVIPKDGPLDKLGNLALIDGKLSIIEYSDLPESLAKATTADGSLKFSVGNPAIHIFSVAFLRDVTQDADAALPFHLAKKKVPHWTAEAGNVEPEKENALKFERFIFDVLPRCAKWAAVATSRADEFAPLKNATGADSPESVKAAISDQGRRWLAAAGVMIPADTPVEVRPTVALEPADLIGKALLSTDFTDGHRLKTG